MFGIKKLREQLEHEKEMCRSDLDHYYKKLQRIEHKLQALQEHLNISIVEREQPDNIYTVIFTKSEPKNS